MKKQLAFLLFLFVCFTSVVVIASQAPITPHLNNRTDKRKCSVAICAVFQHEAPYLKEWIEYHRMIGVGHFYLYNNLSNDDYLKVLLPYIKKGIVELFDYPGTPFTPANQIVPYKHALELARKTSKWFSIIDIDEFITMTHKNFDLAHYLDKNFSYAAGVVMNWQCYGTSGVWDLKPGELLIEKLTLKAPVNYDSNFLFKSIARSNCIDQVADPHIFSYKNGSFAVYPDASRFSHTPLFKEPPVKDLRVNHYFFRTEKFYYEIKVPRREIYEKGQKPKAVHEKIISEHNVVSDPVMLQYVPELKRRMFKK